jgi:hypothetical protein
MSAHVQRLLPREQPGGGHKPTTQELDHELMCPSILKNHPAHTRKGIPGMLHPLLGGQGGRKSGNKGKKEHAKSTLR